MFVLAARLLRSDTEPGELQMVLKGAAAQHHHRDGAAVVGADPADPSRRRRVRGTARLAGRRARPPIRCRSTATRVLQGSLTGSCTSTAIARSAEIDVGIPRWSEDPTHIIGVLTTLFDKPNPLFAGPVFAPISGQLPAARHDGAGPGAGGAGCDKHPVRSFANAATVALSRPSVANITRRASRSMNVVT